MEVTQTVMTLFVAAMLWLALLGLMSFQLGMVRSKSTTTLCCMNFLALVIVVCCFIPFSYEWIHSPQHPVNQTMLQLFAILQQSVTVNAIKLPNVTAHPQALIILYALQACVTLMLIAGSTAERLKLWPFLLFSLFFIAFIYPLQSHWIWGGGFLQSMGYIDWSGATWLYFSAAIASAVALRQLGPRQGRYSELGEPLPLRASNIPLLTLGALFFFWGASWLNACGVVNHSQAWSIDRVLPALINSLLAGSAGFLIALMTTRFFRGLADITIAINGCFAAVAAVAVDPAHFSLFAAMCIGLTASILMSLLQRFCIKMKIDDPCGFVSSFISAGIVGAIVAVFTQDYNVLTQIYGREWHWTNQLLVQVSGLVVVTLWVGLSSYLIWKSLHWLIGIRIDHNDEERGLDVHECGMSSYPEFTHSGR